MLIECIWFYFLILIDRVSSCLAERVGSGSVNPFLLLISLRFEDILDWQWSIERY